MYGETFVLVATTRSARRALQVGKIVDLAARPRAQGAASPMGSGDDQTLSRGLLEDHGIVTKTKTGETSEAAVHR